MRFPIFVNYGSSLCIRNGRIERKLQDDVIIIPCPPVYGIDTENTINAKRMQNVCLLRTRVSLSLNRRCCLLRRELTADYFQSRIGMHQQLVRYRSSTRHTTAISSELSADISNISTFGTHGRSASDGTLNGT